MDYSKIANKLLQDEPKHSREYHEGLAAVLQNRVEGTPVSCPYKAGSAAADAFFAGRMRAHHEFRNALEELSGDREAVIARLRAIAEDRRAA